MTSDQEFAQALALARKAGVQVVQNRHGGITCYVKPRKGMPRRQVVGGFGLKRRLARVAE